VRVLVGCEESGVVRRAFAAKGHDAWSCDLQPARDNHPNHWQKDIFDVIYFHGPWDLMILHPPCTYMCSSGNRHYANSAERNQAEWWTKDLWNVAIRNCPKVVLENPVGTVWKAIGVKPQYIQPYWFGHMETKKTGLAIHGLPRLEVTNIVYDQMMRLPKAQRSRIHYTSPGPLRSRIRSETYQGIADALADQYG